MNSKKIWMLAIGFGLMMSVIFYFVSAPNNNDASSEKAMATQETESESHEPETDGQTKEDGLSIEKGKRAISLPVDSVQSVTGFIAPGSFVDVIAISTHEAEGGSTTSQILLQHIKVLAVGKTVEVNSEEVEPYQLITLEVKPEDGAKLALAKQTGYLTFMLEGSSEE